MSKKNLPASVYVIGTKDWHFTKDGPVKIGLAADPQARLATLQIGCPDRLILRGIVEFPNRGIAKFVERELHNAFSECRLHGEWFDAPSIDPLVYIDQEAIDDSRFVGIQR